VCVSLCVSLCVTLTVCGFSVILELFEMCNSDGHHLDDQMQKLEEFSEQTRQFL